jgi:hypothetical protein
MTHILDPIADVLRTLAFQVEQVSMSARNSADFGLEHHLAEAVFHMPDQI